MPDLIPDEIPDGPLFPQGEAGARLLDQILNPQPAEGPPYTHVFEAQDHSREPQYDEDGDPWWPVEPTFTISPADGAGVPDDPEMCVHARESLGAFPLRGWLFTFRRFGCPLCEQEAHEAWVQEVRARFESALTAIGNGWGYTWDAPGVYTRPDLPANGSVKTYADGTTSVAFDGRLP